VPNEIAERAKIADLVVIGHRGVNERFSTGLLGGTAESVRPRCPRPLSSVSRFHYRSRC
jgi:nucleotide-binding universal stress UspA family protein